jgi:hypothetical protein
VKAGEDDGHQTADLDEREQACQHHRFQNAPRCHRREQDSHDHHDQALRQIDELLDIARRSERHGSR